MPGYLNDTGNPESRKVIYSLGHATGGLEVANFYPDVTRDRREIERMGLKMAEKHLRNGIEIRKVNFPDDIFTDDEDEFKRLFQMGFVAEYLKQTAHRDSYENELTANIRVKEISRSEGVFTYQIELSDYGFLKRPYLFEVIISPNEEIELRES